ncbi:hypothetical protein ACFCX0_39685 [Streptomyces sp. NPDC056352]|uniref:hypothetical protein n=1 Tax=Streptomyces sp. NPDC056352 TaxID=3345791 RepID=UPI0035DEA1CD
MVIELTHDQAFVLSDWLYEVMMKSDKLDAIVPDRAVWSGIYAISGTLEKSLVEIFMPDYAGRLGRHGSVCSTPWVPTRTRKSRRHKACQASHLAMTSAADTNTVGYRRILPDSCGRWTQHRPGFAVVRDAHGPT